MENELFEVKSEARKAYYKRGRPDGSIKPLCFGYGTGAYWSWQNAPVPVVTNRVTRPTTITEASVSP